MKRLTGMVLAAVLGSALTIGGFLLLVNNNNTVKIEHITGTPAVGTTYTVDNNGEIIPLDFKSVSKKVMPAVVHIRSTQLVKNRYGNSRPDPYHEFFREFFGPQYRDNGRDRGPRARVGSGSGVIINKDGYIVTNNHVIANADDIEVTLNDNRTYKATVIGTDPSTDLALIQIKEKDLPYVPLVDSDNVEVGEWVIAVGNPFNLTSTVTAGIVSAKARNINILRDRSAIESFIQTDAAINPGNSGGALVNLQGGLIGINTAIASNTGSYTGYGFAVPSNIVNKVIEDLMKYGIVQRGYLGVSIRSVDAALAKEKELDVFEGVYINGVSENSGAEKAGIKEGDVIVKIDNTTIKSTAELLEKIGRHRPGDKVKVTINRFGNVKDIDVTLRNIDGETKIKEKKEINIIERLGIEIEDVSDEDAKKLDIEKGIRINKLKSGILKSKTSIKEGFIITKVDGRPVTTAKSLTKYLKNKKGGVMIEGIYDDYPGTYYYAFGL
jgi:Do/DeqQ family serine protease